MPGRTNTFAGASATSPPCYVTSSTSTQARLENDAQCLLVIIGATPEGKKELVA